MLPIDFTAVTQVICEPDAERFCGEMISVRGGKHVLIHYGGAFIETSGLLTRVENYLRQAGLEVTVLDGVQPNPRLSLVRKGIDLCREKKIDFILAIGGGSSIDSFKAIALGVPYAGDVWDFFTGAAPVERSLPVGAILTISAAGSEVSNGTVITNEDGWFKRSVNDTAVISPKLALLNPKLTLTLPIY